MSRGGGTHAAPTAQQQQPRPQAQQRVAPPPPPPPLSPEHVMLRDMRHLRGLRTLRPTADQVDVILARLPTRTLPSAREGSGRAAADELVCSICLEPLAGGDEARTLPCFHEYHAVCIETWLRTGRGGCLTCPICHHPAGSPGIALAQTQVL